MVSAHEQYLAFAARKAATRREYLAYYLAQYQKQEGTTEKALMELVGCSGESYFRLALCRVPDTQAVDFALRLERVVTYAGASAVKVAQVIRQVATIEALGSASQPDVQDEADAGQAKAPGVAASDVVPQTQRIVEASEPRMRARARRSIGGSALLAARDRVKQEASGEEASDAEPEDTVEE